MSAPGSADEGEYIGPQILRSVSSVRSERVQIGG